MQRQRKRRLKDLHALQNAGHCFEDFDSEDEPKRVLYLLTGPKDTPYFGRKWRVSIHLPSEYPFKSPSVGFVDPIFHPNIDVKSGSVCLNALNSEWTPMYKLVDVVEVLLPKLLTYPSADDPLNAYAAQLWQTNMEAFNTNVISVGGYVSEV